MNEKSRIIKVISGGQTGADRGGLDAAIDLNLDHGGWCPKGRRAENGKIPDKYKLTELNTSVYARRTEKNVMDSTATAVICHGEPKGGSRKTIDYAVQYAKPFIIVDLLSGENTIQKLANWIESLHNDKIVLNIAGSRASGDPILHQIVHSIIKALLMQVNEIKSSTKK